MGEDKNSAAIRSLRQADADTRLIHDIDSDTDYSFIAEYTSNDVPYAITWEEARQQGLTDEQPSDEPPEFTE